MNYYPLKKYLILLSLTLVVSITFMGCGQSNDTSTSSSLSSSSRTTSSEAIISSSEAASLTVSSSSEESSSPSDEGTEKSELTVRFGDDGAAFTMHLYDNETAKAIAKHVGTAAWRLPIYDYDNFDNWEVMQYYDIPNRYEIPSSPEAITEEKIGEVYYSDPNRIVLFYGDGQVNGEYTKIGYFDPTEEFANAVRENPVLEGWGNKIINISLAD